MGFKLLLEELVGPITRRLPHNLRSQYIQHTENIKSTVLL